MASYIWHPFYQPRLDPEPLHIVRGSGAYLYTADETKYLDAISSWWCNLHGHAHPFIAKKIAQQARQLEHVIFANATHPPAIDLVNKLIPILPKGIKRCFFSDNGSCAIEVAIKMATQYFHNQRIKKQSFVCLRDGYHGDTIGAMSLVAPTVFSQPFHRLLFKSDIIDPPIYGQEEKSIKQAESLFSTNRIAAFIYEPVVQGAAGMRMYNPEGLDAIIKLAKHYGVLCIADEIFTGFGRTGPLFASNYMSTPPDIICLSKGLTGGFLPLAITATSEAVYQQFVSQQRDKSFLHGHTYTANPLGCAAASASLDLTLSPRCQDQRTMIENCHKEFQKSYGSQWQRCHVLGTILALDYPSSSSGYFSDLRDPLHHFFLKQKILLRPLGNTIYVVPPYCISKKDLKTIYHCLQDTLCLHLK
ncbi:adenosylmethionine-8-amino-7-oxononanoate transaminase [Chlamydia ibidis]|uniref:Adenosylmethionine-8-amino-7-oxononanoate aminotransferase n=3 Tax=Chlamydia ibidis TaxID=1405396 RepID=S7J3M2_9CHLA|nr:adenosylmethionine-8-amino-7-oxononanoate transaminase [Chlamydia ibidis]EQM62376.1 adenosylmethionine-8-amino-7-oxononanoate transaminase [Chlamydia ibidis 10-1398/6]